MKQRMLLIVNPNSGTRRIVSYLPKLNRIFSNADYDVAIYLTNQRHDAEEIVVQQGAQKDLIVCCGGDGTLNEVISGLMRLDQRPRLAYIPAGTTNDFSTTLGISKHIMTAAKDCINGQPHALDLGCINGRYFSYIASFGAFTESSYNTPQSLKNALGHLAYVLEGAKDLLTLQPHHLKLTVNGEELEGDYIFGAVSNTTSIGGVLKLNDALVRLNDGLLELMLIHSPKTVIELREILHRLSKQDYQGSPMITFKQASKIHIHSESGLPWSLDGEYFEGDVNVSVEAIPGALTLICQKG
ncbi:MAG: diacylglycerol kinase family lipid kinase [Clostridia bacterium]|nr:diacylglycerol kinase family lipid kinase [Clostridia bacterium]